MAEINELERIPFDAAGRKIRHARAAAFGAARGWTFTLHDFTIASLIRCANLGWQPDHQFFVGSERYQFLDHPYCYRVGRWPAAIAAHSYAPREILEVGGPIIAERLNLKFSLPDEISWYLPTLPIVLWETKVPRWL
jgi:hypothetical protein